MKNLLITLALLITAPAITSSAPYRVYSFNLDSLVTVEIVVFDSLPCDSPGINHSEFRRGRERGLGAYYRQGAGTTTGIITVLFIPAGLLTALIFSAIPANANYYGQGSDEVSSNKSYHLGYKRGLNNAKLNSVWKSFLKGFGLAVFIGLIFTLAADT